LYKVKLPKQNYSIHLTYSATQAIINSKLEFNEVCKEMLEARINQLQALVAKSDFNLYRLSKATQIPFHSLKKLVLAPSIPDGTNYKTLRKVATALNVGLDDLEEEK